MNVYYNGREWRCHCYISRLSVRRPLIVAENRELFRQLFEAVAVYHHLRVSKVIGSLLLHNYGVDYILCITDNVCVTEIHVCHLL